MVYIKSLICEGFKSFKEKTKINFSRGFTSIVGSNGSGKSNILDAFVFAIGELSGNKMRVNNIKDLICNGGSNGGTPSKSARVDVVFDNSDKNIPVNSTTVKISRTINIDGKGKYLLNDKGTTRRELQDIMDLAGILPNSTNLIMQGELFRIINMNNNERRGLIEDIAGIASYEIKKEKAEKDLQKVEEDISRITLLLNELSIQIDSLEKEKNEALKYQEYDVKQKKAENAIIVLKLKNFEKQIEKICDKKVDLEKIIEEIKDNIVVKKVNLMEVTSELEIINKEITKLQSNELKELTLKLNEIKTERTKKETQKENFEKSISKVKKNLIETFAKKEEIEKNKENIQNNLLSKKEERKVIKEKLSFLKDELYHCESQITEFDSRYKEFRENLESIKIKIQGKNELGAEIKSEIKLLKNKFENATEKLNTSKKRKEKLIVEISQLHNEIGELNKNEVSSKENPTNKFNIEDLESKKKRLEKKYSELQPKLNEKHEKLISIRSKIKTIQNLSKNKAIEAILKFKNNPELKSKYKVSGKIYGTIRQLGKTREEFNVALQIAGGYKFNYLVVDTQSTARECINFLKTNKIGRASFIPLNKIYVNPISYELPKNNGIIGRAVDLIQFDSLFRKAFDFVFGRTIVVSDINVATKIEQKVRKVTLKGDVVEASNLMTGGKFKQNLAGGFITQEESKISTLELEINEFRRELESNSKKLKEIEAQISLSYRNKISSNTKLSEIREKLAVLKEIVNRKEEESKNDEKNFTEYETEITNLEKKIQEEQLKLDDNNQIIAELTSKENEVKSKISLLENNDFTQKITKLREEIDESEKENIRIKLELTKLNTQIEDISNNRESEIESVINNYQEEIKNNILELETIKKELGEIDLTINKLESEVLEKNEYIGKFYSKKEEVLLAQTNTKLEIGNLQSSIHPNEIKLNTLEIKLQNMMTQKVELEEVNQINDTEIEKIQDFLKFSQEKLSNIMDECLEIKHRLEPVNMRAIKKYDKIKKRYDDLIEKHGIVVEERLSILEFIEKVEQEKKSTFLITFDGINEQFKSIFAKLSPDGEAKLELENTEDPFAGGVKILARPGGKKWCLTQSMSGGEKTLTVIALVLGIQMYIPSPYYILDEIDAALDDFNATQVASMIKDLSLKSQFILVTHRDVTMTKTDQLLGVSNIHGITSILNVNMQEALEYIAES